MKIAAAYIRVSTDDQMEYSPDSQLKVIRDYAKQNGYILPEEFIFEEQEGRSGRKAAKRPAFQAMIAAAKHSPPPFEAILCWKFSRFARNQEESIVYKSMLHRDGVSVISVSEPLVEGPFGGLIERIIEWMDEYYSIRLSGEVKRGMTEKASRGGVVTLPAFGYRIKDGVYVPDKKYAPIVVEIFERFAAGESMLHLARDLTDRGVRTYRGSPIELRTVQYILSNPVYIGKIRWTPSGKRKRTQDSEDTMIVDGGHRPIINDELWQRVQTRVSELRAAHQPHMRAPSEDSPMLQGLLRCSACGSTLSRNSGKSYQCVKYVKGLCKESHYVTIRLIDAAVIAQLESDAQRGTWNLNMEHRSEKKANDKPSQQLRAALRRENVKLQRCMEAYQSGIDTLEEYRSNKAAIQAEIKRIEDELQSAPPPAVFDAEAFRLRLLNALPTLRDPTVSTHEKNRVLRTFVTKILYDKKHESIRIFYFT